MVGYTTKINAAYNKALLNLARPNREEKFDHEFSLRLGTGLSLSALASWGAVHGTLSTAKHLIDNVLHIPSQDHKVILLTLATVTAAGAAKYIVGDLYLNRLFLRKPAELGREDWIGQ